MENSFLHRTKIMKDLKKIYIRNRLNSFSLLHDVSCNYVVNFKER